MNTNVLRFIKSYWNHLKGHPSDFSMQSRIYHSICLIIMAIMVYNIPFSLILGLYEATIATLVLLIFQYVIFYLSRYRNRTYLSFSLFIIISNSFFGYIYFSNNGINGSSLLSLSISYFMVLLVVPRKHYGIWTTLYTLLVGGLLYTEYFYPALITDSYDTRADRFIDIGSTFLMSMILFLSCLTFVINNYNLEKQTAEDKTLVLKKLNDQKNKLISVISHDFNTPLNNIKRYLHIMQQMEVSTEERNQLERELMQVTMDTQNLLLNLLNWTKNNMDSMNHTTEIVNIHDALADTVQLYRKIAGEKLIFFDYNISPEVNVEGNYEMIDIIMRNLISNAVKFTHEGGHIIIDASEENGFYRLSIKDNGSGIPESQQQTLFTTHTAPSYGTRNEKGVGLGLSLCKEFTEAMNGQIGYESEPGIKTEFFICLPAVHFKEDMYGMDEQDNKATSS